MALAVTPDALRELLLGQRPGLAQASSAAANPPGSVIGLHERRR